MAQASGAVLTELSTHLQVVDQDPNTRLDVDLLEKCQLLTSTPEYRARLWQETGSLFLQIAALLPKLQQDPAPLVDFVTRLAAPYRFENVKDIDFEAALDLQATPFHSLILSLLEKAAATSNDAQALANRPTVVAAIVRLWLCTQDAGVATLAENLLTALLRASKNGPAAVSEQGPLHMYGTGHMWKRLFKDRDIVALYYHYTSLKALSDSPPPRLSKRDKTISQARLLHWLTVVGALDWSTIATGHNLDIEKEVGLEEGQGLLHYASSKMVDTDDDVLMHMTLIHFFKELITTVRTKPHLTPYDSSLSLDFLKEQGIHQKIIDIHTTPNPLLEYSFLTPGTGQYISGYASTYPDNFENSPESQTILTYIGQNIEKYEPQDLSILASLPRATLIPRNPAGQLSWYSSPLLSIPMRRTTPDAIKTLASIFHGPPAQDITFPQVESLGQDSKRTEKEAVLARLLTSLYYHKHLDMFTDLVAHVSTIAMKDSALAALGFLRAIITSSWSTVPLPDIIPESDPNYIRFQNFPSTGLDLIADVSRSASVVPFLMRPPTTFSGLVGGHGDAENAAYQIAMAKFAVVKELGKCLEKNDGSLSNLRDMVRARINEGPWGLTGSVGSRIGTLDL